jgi:polysaccharide biosynthesis protein VpsM
MKPIATFVTLCLIASPATSVFAGNHRVIDINDILIVAADTPKEGLDTMQDMPMGQGSGDDVSLLPEESGAAGDLYGIEGGYLHPYVSLTGEYTDNVYNVDTDTTSNFLTTLSPGIWFSLPRKQVIPIKIVPHNSAAGGLSGTIGDYDGTDTFQVYGLAGTDLLFYSEDSDLNTVDVGLEGLTRYNMASGLSLQLLDRYSLGHDGFGVGVATDSNQREFQSNIVMATADWDMTEKLRFKVDLSNFYLGYDEDINAFLERQDNSADVYGFYKYSPKSSVFLEYRYVDVEYDTDTDTNNNQNFYYGGVRWDTTEKLSLLFKAGLQQKEYDDQDVGYNDTDNPTFDLQTLYRFTEKTQASLDAYYLTEESDSSEAAGKDVLGVSFAYTQRFTEKITGKLDLFYENADYDQLIDTDRTDDTFEIKPAIQYLFKDWLMAELAYSFEMDDSSDDTFDYETNTFYMSLNFSI